jgi:hypothetical protein
VDGEANAEQQFWAANDLMAPRGCVELRRQLDILRSLAPRGSHGTYLTLVRGAASH